MNIEPNDFDQWNKRKQFLHTTERSTTIFNERDVWWSAIGQNIGNEQNGKHENYERPVLVFRKFGENTFWGMPMTSNISRGDSRTQYTIPFKGKSQTIDILQLRIMSNKRLLRLVGQISFSDFQHIRNIFADLK